MKKPVVVILLIVILLAALGGGWWWYQSSRQQPLTPDLAVGGIAHQRQSRLNILQRMAARQRKRTCRKWCHVPKTRREMLRDFRL